eukprot:4292127-Pyramimonas_sp.AAC.1
MVNDVVLSGSGFQKPQFLSVLVLEMLALQLLTPPADSYVFRGAGAASAGQCAPRASCYAGGRWRLS